MMAKKIQSNICGMLKPFNPGVPAINGCRTPRVAGSCSRRLTEALPNLALPSPQERRASHKS